MGANENMKVFLMLYSKRNVPVGLNAILSTFLLKFMLSDPVVVYIFLYECLTVVLFFPHKIRAARCESHSYNLRRRNQNSFQNRRHNSII